MSANKRVTTSALNTTLKGFLTPLSQSKTVVPVDELLTMENPQSQTGFTYYHVRNTATKEELIVTETCKDTHTTVAQEIAFGRTPNAIPSVKDLVTRLKADKKLGQDYPPVLIPIVQVGTVFGFRRNHFVLGVLIWDQKTSQSQLKIIDSRPSMGGLFYSNPVTKVWDEKKKKWVKDTAKEPLFTHQYRRDYFCHGAQHENYNCGRFVLSAISKILGGQLGEEQGKKRTFIERLKSAPKTLMGAIRRLLKTTDVVEACEGTAAKLPITAKKTKSKGRSDAAASDSASADGSSGASSSSSGGSDLGDFETDFTDDRASLLPREKKGGAAAAQKGYGTVPIPYPPASTVLRGVHHDAATRIAKGRNRDNSFDYGSHK